MTAHLSKTHASLDDWSEGYKWKKSDLRADAYEDVYKGHELFLSNLRNQKPIFYHTLMSGLYTAVS